MITQDPQAVFPNQFFSALIRGNRLFLPNIGAQPEPPVQFTANVQALVHVVNTQTRTEKLADHVNLNDQIDTETPATHRSRQALRQRHRGHRRRRRTAGPSSS